MVRIPCSRSVDAILNEVLSLNAQELPRVGQGDDAFRDPQ